MATYKPEAPVTKTSIPSGFDALKCSASLILGGICIIRMMVMQLAFILSPATILFASLALSD